MQLLPEQVKPGFIYQYLLHSYFGSISFHVPPIPIIMPVETTKSECSKTTLSTLKRN